MVSFKERWIYRNCRISLLIGDIIFGYIEIRSILAGIIPIIAMTANAFAEDVQRCLDAGMNAHLAKPLDIEKVKKTICEHTIELFNKE